MPPHTMGAVSVLSRIRSLFSPSGPAAEPLPAAHWLIVGLGNPGPRYADTRHNVGYLGVDKLIDAHAAPQLRPRRGLQVSWTPLAPEALALRSSTFMNHSGRGVAPLARELGVPPERIIVIHDELDLPAGKVRIKLGGNENGHNGLKSLSEELGTREYLRVRIGISRPPSGMAVPDYVLEPLADPEQIEAVQAGVELAAEAVDLILDGGLSAAQNAIHGR